MVQPDLSFNHVVYVGWVCLSASVFAWRALPRKRLELSTPKTADPRYARSDPEFKRLKVKAQHGAACWCDCTFFNFLSVFVYFWWEWAAYLLMATLHSCSNVFARRLQCAESAVFPQYMLDTSWWSNRPTDWQTDDGSRPVAIGRLSCMCEAA